MHNLFVFGYIPSSFLLVVSPAMYRLGFVWWIYLILAIIQVMLTNVSESHMRFQSMLFIYILSSL